MAKIVRRIVFLLLTALIFTTSFGLSFFYLDDSRSESSNSSTSIDDIKENYNFSKSSSDNSGKTYTIYFFPSASYLHLYYQYLENKTTVKPEDQFGYKEPNYNEDGSLATNNNGALTYSLSSNTGKVSYEGATSSEGSVTYDGAYRRYMGEKFSCSSFEADGGQAYGKYNDANEWPYTAVSNDPYSVYTAYTQSQNSLPSGEKRTWGLPSDKESDNFTIFTDDPDRVEHFNGRNQYSTDRFGSWGDCYYYGKTVKDSNDDGAPTGLLYGDSKLSDSSKMDDTATGRYIPIKLTVTNELMSSEMSQVVQEIFTSMGTLLKNTSYSYRYMHNYTFTEWTYVQNPDDASKRVYPYSYVSNTGEWTENKIGEAFQPQPTSTYFDMFQDLDKYADSEGVIRLFPLFSNGKKSSVSDTDTKNYTLGGGSSQKLTITTTSTSSSTTSTSKEYKYPFFNTDVYNNGTGTFTYGTESTTDLSSSNIRLFSYNSINISKSTTSLEFSANNVTNKPTNWDTETNSDGKTVLKWNKLYTLNSDYIQKNLIDKYGEGAYTFYVFVANYSYQDYSTDNETLFTAFYNNIVSQATSSAFTSLNGKRLAQITALDSEYGENSSYRTSPTVIAAEKIDEPVLTSSTTISNDVATFIKDNSETSRNFYRNVNPLYEGTLSGTTYSTTGSDLSSSSPYTYIVKNVDLTKNKYFTISFNGSTTNVFNTSVTDSEYTYLVSNPSQTGEVSEENVYVNAFASNGNIAYTLNNDELVFSLKDDNALDIYDIIIKYNKNNNKYDLYMRRHNKLFLYVFDSDLSTTTDSFVDHTYSLDEASSTYKTSNDNVLLFDKEYSEGLSILTTDKSETANSSYSLDQILRYYISNISGTTASYYYSDSNLLNYKLIDRVSGEVVAYYEEVVSDSTPTYNLVVKLTMNKNHILYIKNTIN